MLFALQQSMHRDAVKVLVEAYAFIKKKQLTKAEEIKHYLYIKYYLSRSAYSELS